MTDTAENQRSTAHEYVRTARDAFRQSAGVFRALQGDEWHRPTGCEKWDMYALAGHIVGEAVYFAHLVHQAADDAPPLPNELWGQLSALPGTEIADRIESSADELVQNVENVSGAGLEKPADLGFTTWPLYQALYMSAFEGVIHDWDSRAKREQNARIRTDWAVQLASGLAVMIPGLVRRRELADAAGTYLLEVSDGVGPLTLTITEDEVEIEPGKAGSPAITLRLSADGYVRLMTGRYPLPPAIAAGDVHVDGDQRRAEALNMVFAGVANG